jgi:hypothetical protein
VKICDEGRSPRDQDLHEKSEKAVADLKKAKREIRELKKYLHDLVRVAEACLVQLDAVGPSMAGKRGEAIAHVCNQLEMAKDLARHFGLGEKLEKTK